MAGSSARAKKRAAQAKERREGNKAELKELSGPRGHRGSSKRAWDKTEGKAEAKATKARKKANEGIDPAKLDLPEPKPSPSVFGLGKDYSRQDAVIDTIKAQRGHEAAQAEKALRKVQLRRAGAEGRELPGTHPGLYDLKNMETIPNPQPVYSSDPTNIDPEEEPRYIDVFTGRNRHKEWVDQRNDKLDAREDAKLNRMHARMESQRLDAQRQPAANQEASETFRHTTPVSYNYKDGVGEPGRQYGIMAQDLEKTPAGQSTVVRDENGLRSVDTRKLAMLQSGAIKEMLDRLDKLEKKNGR